METNYLLNKLENVEKHVKHIKRKCKTCLGQHFEFIIYIMLVIKDSL